jgi:hypothetical protein
MVNPTKAAAGSKGGKATAANMTREQRVERAKKAIAARYTKAKELKDAA